MKAAKKIALFVAVSLLNFSVACTNIHSSSAINTATGIGVTNNSDTSTAYSQTLKAFSYVSSGTGTATVITLSLAADTSGLNYQPFTGFCGLGSTNPCVCEMDWTQIDNVNSVSYNYPRTKRVPVTEVQTGLVRCALDEATWDEIPDQTVITFKILPAATNAVGASLNTKSLNWKKGTSSCTPGTGTFCDDTLTPFHDIARYTCFSKGNGNRAYEIVNNYTSVSATSSTSGGSTTSYNIPSGSQYCVGSMLGIPTDSSSPSSGAASSGTCPIPRNGLTAQSYYRNFFIPAELEGNINATNDTYDCPLVMESIKYSSGQAVPSSEVGKYWPLDKTFSVATIPTSVWSVGVPAASNLFRNGDVNSTQTLCQDESAAATSASVTPTPNASGITVVPAVSPRLKDAKTVVKCIGYAKKPNTDGTCGTIKDSNGRVRPLTRLRRYRVMYPPMFDATGKVFTTNPFADEVYVADRLVVDSSGNSTGNMVYGPKPCNYAWFDHEGVTKRDGLNNFLSGLQGDTINGFNSSNSGGDGHGYYATPGYRATSDYQYIEDRDGIVTDDVYHAHQWSVDPDGLVIPNVDRNGDFGNQNTYPSCSASLPWVDWSNGSATDLRLITTNVNRQDKVSLGTRNVYLREIANQTVDPWTPNYVEDTSFNACVPLPTTYVEPPLHFYKKDNNTMAWCAEVYPTQNPYWYDLNKTRKSPNAGAGGTAALTQNVKNYPTIAAPNTTALIKTYTSHDTAALPAQASIDNSSALDAQYNQNCTGESATSICTMTGFTSDLTNCKTFIARLSTSKFCDRTVTYSSTQAFLGFPLLANDHDINAMLKTDLDHDRSFSCQYSVNTDASKVNAKIPSTGCCGIVGSSPQTLLRTLPSGGGAHLEPYKDPSATDDSRFCGWPVQ